VTVTPPAPTNVNATASTATSVVVTWSFSGTVDSFQILRFDRAPGAPAGYRMVGTSLTNSFTDQNLTAATSYLYRIRSVVSGTVSPDSGTDVATTVMFGSNVAAGGIMEDADILELRSAVTAMALLAGRASPSYTDVSLAGVLVKSAHIQELRTEVDAARSALLLPAPVYTDQPLTAGTLIRAAHVLEIRGVVK